LEESVKGNVAHPGTSFVVYYYFSFADVKKRTSRNLLCSILLQIANKLPRIPNALIGLYEDYRHGEPPISKLMTTLKVVLAIPTQVFLVIDALDECPQESSMRGDMLTKLKNIMSWELANLHIIATSRNEPDIEAYLLPWIESSPAAHALGLLSKDIDLDIRISLQKQLTMELFNREWWIDLKSEVQQALIEGSNGRYTTSRSLYYLDTVSLIHSLASDGSLVSCKS
jgi:hypothetical protein